MQFKKQPLKPNIEQQTGSKSGKKCVKAVYCHPLYLTYMQVMWNARLDVSHDGIKIAGENINSLRYEDNSIFKAESKDELKSFLMKEKEESLKTGIKQYSKY